MEQYEQYVKVPKDRVAVIIGEKGRKKKELEEAMGVKLDVDSKEGDVRLSCTDTIKLFTAHEIIKAIARGFNPDTAKLLLKTEFVLEIISLTDYAKSKNQMIRLKGRIIGEKGKSRRTIEETSGAFISVYGKTICVIGEAETASAAKRSIDALLTGAPHATVFRMLERWRRDQKRKEFT